MNPRPVQLRDLTEANHESVPAQDVLSEQERFVGTVAGAREGFVRMASWGEIVRGCS